MAGTDKSAVFGIGRTESKSSNGDMNGMGGRVKRVEEVQTVLKSHVSGLDHKAGSVK